MHLVIQDSPDQVGDHVSPTPSRHSHYPQAAYIAVRINAFKPTDAYLRVVLGLPTGSSPLPVYKRLMQMCRDGKVSFKVG